MNKTNLLMSRCYDAFQRIRSPTVGRSDAESLAGLPGPEVVGVSATAAVGETPAASSPGVEEEATLEPSARPCTCRTCAHHWKGGERRILSARQEGRQAILII